MKADGEEFDENDLLDELGDLEDEDVQAAKIMIDQYKSYIASEKTLALKESKAKNMEEAKKHMLKYKKYEADLEEQYKLHPKLRPLEAKPVVVPQAHVEPIKNAPKKEEIKAS